MIPEKIRLEILEQIRDEHPASIKEIRKRLEDWEGFFVKIISDTIKLTWEKATYKDGIRNE